MFRLARKTLIIVAALAALAVGGATFANAASTSTTTSQSAAPSGRPPGPGGAPGGRHVGASGQQEQPLTGTTAAKVKEAALAKVSGGTVERVETDVDHGSPYEAHLRKSDGSELEVLVNKDFEVTAVNAMHHP